MQMMFYSPTFLMREPISVCCVYSDTRENKKDKDVFQNKKPVSAESGLIRNLM